MPTVTTGFRPRMPFGASASEARFDGCTDPKSSARNSVELRRFSSATGESRIVSGWKPVYDAVPTVEVLMMRRAALMSLRIVAVPAFDQAAVAARDCVIA